jgi:hypothetical protein
MAVIFFGLLLFGLVGGMLAGLFGATTAILLKRPLIKWLTISFSIGAALGVGILLALVYWLISHMS